MNAIRLAVIVLLAAPAQAAEDRAVVATPVLTTMVTATGQPIVLPRENPQVRVVTLDIAPGAVLPEHKHPYPHSYNYPHLSTLNQSFAGFLQIMSLCAELFEGPPRQ
jgi:hypothetical protein